MKHLFTFALAAIVSLSMGAQTRYLSTNGESLDMAAIEQTATPVQLSRILFAGYNSICLPMTLTAEQLQAVAPGVVLERLAAIGQEGTTLNLYFVDCTAEGLEAGVPYLIRSPRTQTLRVRTDAVAGVSSRLQPVSIADNNGNSVRFASSWQATSGDGRYGIPAQQTTDELQSILVCTTADKTFLPTRCGFTWEARSATATQLCIRHAGSADEVNTAIQGITTADGSSQPYYDLGGRRHDAPTQRGIYIQQGHKSVKR